MPFDASPLLRPELHELRAYAPGPAAGIEIRLDANEAPPVDSPRLRELVSEAVASVPLERYPDARALALKEKIALRTGARIEDLLVGSGSDEIIALLATALARPRGKGAPQASFLAPTPSFVMYRVTARAHGVRPVEVPLDAAWDLDAGMMKKAIDAFSPNVVFIATPNNPTGNRMSDDRLADVCEHAKDALVVLDEAYVDYAGASLRSFRARFPNVAIMRTLSKVGLAALRVGWLEADAGLVAEMDKARQPFNVSATSQAIAAAVLGTAWEEIGAHVAKVVVERARLSSRIAALGDFEVTPSAANFVWVKTPRPAEETFRALLEAKILVRSFHASGGRLARQIRITIGTPAENDRLVEALSACA